MSRWRKVSVSGGFLLLTAWFALANGWRLLAVLLSDGVMLVSEATLLFFAGRYLKAEQANGTPFTETGAEQLQKLGIRCIWLPIVAAVISCVIVVCLGAEETGDISNLPSLVTGIVLILAAMIFRYGAALEEKCK